jgi:ABC-type lipoprotein export system ATPase subunit
VAEEGPVSVVIRAQGLRRSFRVGPVEVHAVDGVDLEIRRGEFAALKGRSGSGKTTLLNLLGGLDRATQGEVYLNGRALSALSDDEMTTLRRRDIGFVFQSFALLPTFSAYENVELPLRIARVDAAERSARAHRCLDLVGLANRADHRPDEMSGGQQQRVAIARALVGSPSLILADEPTGELDSRSGEQVMELFLRIAREDGVTVVMASHDPIVDEYAEVVYEMTDGRISATRRRDAAPSGQGQRG